MRPEALRYRADALPSFSTGELRLAMHGMAWRACYVDAIETNVSYAWNAHSRRA